MTPPRLHPALVADPAAVETLVRALREVPRVALDTESNSFHAYRERVCLIQLSIPGRDWIVDPLATGVEPLGRLLCDGRETVLHGADYDVRCLKRDFGWVLPNIFDTMVAARRLGVVGLGLSALVEARFGVRLSKAHQRSDWGRRPLTEEQLAYAALDTHYLLALRDALGGELDAKGLTAAAAEEFRRIAAARPHERIFDPEGWRRLKGARQLEPAGQRALRALWIAREARAEALGRPPFKVLGELALVEIARRRPADLAGLAAITGVTPGVIRNVGDAVLRALGSAEGQP